MDKSMILTIAGPIVGLLIGIVCANPGGISMLTLIKDRIANLVQLITSKKTLVGVAAAAVIIQATDLSKIIAIGSIAVAYILVQGLIDLQKAKQAK